MNKAQQLLNYKDKISDLEQEESQEKGKQQLQSKRLLDEFHCKNIREANREFDKIDKAISQKEEKYQDHIRELNRLFNSQ